VATEGARYRPARHRGHRDDRLLKHIAVIQGHPDPQGRHYCHALAEAYATGAREAGHAVEMIDIAHLEFPFLRSRDDVEHGSVPDAIREAQAVSLITSC